MHALTLKKGMMIVMQMEVMKSKSIEISMQMKSVLWLQQNLQTVAAFDVVVVEGSARALESCGTHRRTPATLAF
jgi:hypothetical protein